MPPQLGSGCCTRPCRGPNWRWLPSAAILRLGHAFIECGADIVFGHR